MSARHEMWSRLCYPKIGWRATETHANELLDAFAAEVRAEVLREAAALVEDRSCDADFTAEPEFIAGLRTAVELLNRAAKSGPAPEAVTR